NTGKILRTTNGGDSWSQVSTTTTRDFYGMFFLNSKIGWVVGGATVVEGIVYKTTDGGINWVSQGKPANTPLMAVFFVDSNTGWAVGMDGVIIKTNNGGNDWTAQNSGGTSWFTDVYFQDANVGFAVGDGVILRTTNGGNTWIPKGSIAGVVEDIRFIDQMNGWAVGTGAGVAKGIGGNTAGIHLLSYGSSKIWRTEDGGETWTEELLAGQWLLSTFFNDLNSGWAVGNYGNIFKYANSLPLPQPPSDLKALAISKTEIQLFWTDNSTTENGFHIYRSAGVSGEYKFLTTVEKDSASYTDVGLGDGTTYWYRLDAFNAYGNSAKSKDASATAGVILSVDVQPDVPLRFALKQNYPNPFNPSTIIQYSIPKASQVELKVFDLLGRELKVLVNGKLEAGIYQVQFDSKGLPAGLYFYRLRAGEFCETRKMVIVK
ncbi:MAG TPA: YCF48-related protein, partial [bacterium]